MLKAGIANIVGIADITDIADIVDICYIDDIDDFFRKIGSRGRIGHYVGRSMMTLIPTDTYSKIYWLERSKDVFKLSGIGL